MTALAETPPDIDSVTEALRSEILTGKFASGDPLREVALAERFSLSRAAMRAILQKLAHEGFAEARPNCGIRVAKPPEDGLERLVGSLRRQIEVYALKACFDSLDGEDFAIFESILERMRIACEAGDHADVAESDVAFHRYLVERSGMPDLVALWLPMLSRLRRSFLAAQQQDEDGDLVSVYHEHAAILSSLRAGNLQPALLLLEASID